LAPSIVLEIGTASGGTLFLWTKTASPDAMIISIDLPGGAFGGGYPKERIPYYKSFASDNQKISLLREDSHSLVTLDEVKGIIDNRKVDFLFIDGDHSYEGVKKDFEMYSGLVRKGGIVAFHDICHHVGVATCNVELFWSETKNSYKFKEIIKDSNQEWAGIGVLYM
jgi:cephalosporin hydroxylase